MERKSLLEHWEELRKRFLVSTGIWIFFSLIGFLISDKILKLIRKDLIDSYGVKLIVTHPLDIFYMKINLGIFFGILISLPIFLYEIYRFIKPGLTKKEKKMVKLYILSGSGLFVTGVIFAYFILIKFIVWFFSGMASSTGIENFWNINYFISFVIFTSFLMGLIFQLPLLLTLLLALDIISLKTLKENRGYVIIGIFTVAAIITPPDPITQVLVALPLIGLYEGGIWINEILLKKLKT